LLTVFGLIFSDPATQLIQHCEQHSYDFFQDRFASDNRIDWTAASRHKKIKTRCGLQSGAVCDLQKSGAVLARKLTVSFRDIQSDAVASALQMIASRGPFG